MSKSSHLRLFASTLTLGVALMAGAAVAQDAGEEDAIVVTGSRIRTDP